MELTAEQQNTLNKLVTQVTLRVDEYTENLEENVPDAPIGDIKYELEESARSLVRMTARHSSFIVSKELKDADLDIVDPGEGSKGGKLICVPEDYLRFLSIKLNDWDRPANRLISDNSRAYNQQIYEQRRGTPEKPVAAIVPFHHSVTTGVAPDEVTTIYKRAIEVFPADGGDVESFVYLPYVNYYDMPSEFHDALVWKTVVSVLLIMRLANEAKLASEKEARAIAELNSGIYGDQPRPDQ